MDSKPNTERNLTIVGGIPGAYTYKIDGVDVLQCPFDKSHMMRANRFQYHLVKCVKQHPGEKIVCPYNATEFIDAEQYSIHLVNCESKRDIEVANWNSQLSTSRYRLEDPPVPRPQAAPYEIDEYW